MNILALEFSSAQREVAVLCENTEGVAILRALIRNLDYHTVTPLMLVDQALSEAGLGPDAVELIAIGLGPGSFTGIRSAIAVAQGWQLGGDVKSIGQGTVQVLGSQAWDGGIRGEFQVAIDAQRGDVYQARFHASDEGFQQTGPLTIITLQEAANNPRVLTVGPEVEKQFANYRTIFPSAEKLGRIAAKTNLFISAQALEPVNLRPLNFVKAPAPRSL